MYRIAKASIHTTDISLYTIQIPQHFCNPELDIDSYIKCYMQITWQRPGVLPLQILVFAEMIYASSWSPSSRLFWPHIDMYDLTYIICTW